MQKIIGTILLSIFLLTNITIVWGQPFNPTQVNQQLQETIENATEGGAQATATTTTTQNNTSPPGSINGMTINEDCLVNGQCKFNIYDTLGIRKSVRGEDDPTSVGLFVQDVVLSATFFIGTIVTVALIVAGMMYIFAAASGKDPSNAKKGITGALIGLVIVASSYFIIRLIQYLAKGV